MQIDSGVLKSIERRGNVFLRTEGVFLSMKILARHLPFLGKKGSVTRYCATACDSRMDALTIAASFENKKRRECPQRCKSMKGADHQGSL